MLIKDLSYLFTHSLHGFLPPAEAIPLQVAPRQTFLCFPMFRAVLRIFLCCFFISCKRQISVKSTYVDQHNPLVRKYLYSKGKKRFFHDVYILTVNGICLLIASRGVPFPPEISGTTKGMTMKLLPDVGIHKRARNQITIC